jgi:hypothetical protein
MEMIHTRPDIYGKIERWVSICCLDDAKNYILVLI